MQKYQTFGNILTVTYNEKIVLVNQGFSKEAIHGDTYFHFNDWLMYSNIPGISDYI